MCCNTEGVKPGFLRVLGKKTDKQHLLSLLTVHAYTQSTTWGVCVNPCFTILRSPLSPPSESIKSTPALVKLHVYWITTSCHPASLSFNFLPTQISLESSASLRSHPNPRPSNLGPPFLLIHVSLSDICVWFQVRTLDEFYTQKVETVREIRLLR